MERIFVFIFLFIAFASCNTIPNKPVVTKLTTNELSRAIKADSSFATFYKNIRNKVDKLSDIKRAEYNEVTYKRLFNYIKFFKDTTYWKPKTKKWEQEWENKFGVYSVKADSLIDYWKNYLKENSLNKYVKIELVRIDKEGMGV